MKKALSVLFALSLALLSVITVGATSIYDDINYSGVMGSYYDDGTGESDGSDSRITLTDGVSYDSAKKLYYYSTSLGFVTSDIYDGMMTTSAIKLDVPEEIDAKLYKDGEIVDGDISTVSEPGRYNLCYADNSGIETAIFSFVICSSITCDAGAYTLPDGFSVDGLIKDGTKIASPSTVIPLTENGVYSIEYHCNATGVRYTLNLTVDTVPPELTFTGLDDGSAWGPVGISGVEENGTVLVYRDGQEEAYSDTLTKSGNYEIIALDEAGNKTVYNFTIMIYLNKGSIVFFVILVLIAAGVGAYVIVSRKKLRVR